MLSHNLKRLHDHLDPYGDTGAEVASDAMVQILAILEDAIDKAQDLEASATVSATHDRGSAKGQSANVILFPACARPDQRTGEGAA